MKSLHVRDGAGVAIGPRESGPGRRAPRLKGSTAVRLPLRSRLMIGCLVASAMATTFGSANDEKTGTPIRISGHEGGRLRDSLAEWSRVQCADNWPLSNVGDPVLKGVVFLYDASIAAQARLAAGDRDAARELLRRVARVWPRAQ